MDYLDPNKKRSHTRRLFLGYGLMAIVIGLGTILLVLLAYGYTFDRTSRTVIQNGLLFVQMGPINADVYVNGELHGSGNQRLVLPAGTYDIGIEAEGYKTWQNSVDLAGGAVERFQYPLLFPEEVSERTYRTFSEEPRLITVSPDRRWLLIQEAEQADAFVLFDLRQQINLPTFFSLPVGIISNSSADSQLDVVEWSNDNEHLIIRHSFDDTEEFILVNHNDVDQSQNLSTRFADIDFTDISLVDKQADQYHLFDRSTGELAYAELAVDSVELLLEDVLTYRSHGPETVLFTSISSHQQTEPDAAVEVNEEAEDKAYAYLYDEEELYLIDELPSVEPSDYLLDLARFGGDWYVVIGTKEQQRVVGYKNPVEQLDSNDNGALSANFALRTEEVPSRISFSANARNVLLQTEKDVAAFDLERERGYRYDFSDGAVSRLRWMDGHRIIGILDDQLHVVDFDGENRHELGSCKAGREPVFDTAYEHMYCIAPTDNDSYGALVRHALLAPDDSD